MLSIFTACKKTDKGSAAGLLVAAASNVQFVLEELLNDFEEKHGIPCEAVVSSSGKLSSQIMSGANFDVFISADQYYPNFIFEEGMAEGRPELYAKGSLVYWSTSIDLKAGDFNIGDDRFKKIAIANPKLAPYGRAAEQALEKMGLIETLRERFVYGENISQVNQFVSLGAADIGITSQSIVFAQKGGEEGTWLKLDDSTYEPILQDLVLLRNGRSTKVERRMFMDYILSERGQSILRKYGYRTSTL